MRDADDELASLTIPSTRSGRYRLALLVLVVVLATLKLIVAGNTLGSGDVRIWRQFAADVSQAGPVGIYRLDIPQNYNHPPLMGYVLEVINFETRLGISFPLAIRIPAILADAVTPFIVLELLRKRRSQLEAFAAAASVAASPVLFIISGFHGNTDPVFIMFALASVYLLVDRRAPALAGLAIAAALGVKVVAIVVVPTLLVFAARAGWRTLRRFVLASGALMVLTWGPAVVGAWQPFTRSVFGYTGGKYRIWGLAQIGNWAGRADLVTRLAGPGRFLVVFLAAFVPAAAVARHPSRAVDASGLALTVFLLLSPAFGTQYLVWAVAPAYLVTFFGATAYNLASGVFLTALYTRWSGGFPWYRSVGQPLTPGEIVGAFAVWATLLMVVAGGIRRSFWFSQDEQAVSSVPA